MTEDNTTTNVQLENGNPAFAKPVLGAVPFTIVHLEDCTKALKRFDDNYFDVAIVDPPYGIGRSGQTETFTKNPQLLIHDVSGCALFHGDCFSFSIPEYDYIISDLPYNTKYADWDKGFNANKFFDMKAKGFVLFAVQPLTSELIMANKKQYKYDLVWSKNCYKSNSFKTRPGRQHETILIFGNLPYNAQMTKRTETEMQRLNYEQRKKYQYKNPGSVLFFDAINNRNGNRTGHPAEKPLDLMEWIIKTFTNEGDTIFDPFMGTGTTGVACLKNNRKFIGIEKEKQYFDIAVRRASEYCH